jgi:peroxiredoxin
MRVVDAFVGVVSLTLFACSATPPPKSEPSEMLQRVLPSFAQETLNGTAIDTGGFDGLVLVKFFSIDCDACSHTLPATQAAYKRMPEVTVIGVSEDSAVPDARKTVSKYKLRFPVIVDSDNSIAKSFGVEEPPKAFVADSYGKIRWVGGKDITEDALVAALEAVDD